MAVGALSACSLLTDLHGFDDGVADAGGAGGDGGGGGGGGEGGAASDGAGKDANAVTDAPVAGRFCDSPAGKAAAFCVDFDDGALESGWDKRSVDPNATLDFSSAFATSLPRSLHATMERSAPSANVSVGILEKHFPGMWRRTVVEFDFKVDAVNWKDGDVNRGFLEIGFEGGATQPAMTLIAGKDYFQVYMAGAANGHGVLTDTPMHVRIDVEPALNKVTSTVTIKGVADSQVGNTSFVGAGTSMYIFVGILGYNRPAPDISAYYDNVTVTFL